MTRAEFDSRYQLGDRIAEGGYAIRPD